MARPFKRFLPVSHQDCSEPKDYFLDFHSAQKSEVEDLKSTSLRIETLSFQRPGPRGVGTGIGTESMTAQWSEKGQASISQDYTRWIHG